MGFLDGIHVRVRAWAAQADVISANNADAGEVREVLQRKLVVSIGAQIRLPSGVVLQVECRKQIWCH